MNCFLYIIGNDICKCEKEEDIPREAIRTLKLQICFALNIFLICTR